jgi:hypothetical protein
VKWKHKHDVYKGQTKEVTFAESFLQSNPCNTHIRDTFSTTPILVDIMQQDLDEQAHEAKAKWAYFDNTYSKTFSNSTKPRLKKTSMPFHEWKLGVKYIGGTKNMCVEILNFIIISIRRIPPH